LVEAEFGARSAHHACCARPSASPSVRDRMPHGKGSGITGRAAVARERQQNHGEGSGRATGQPQQAGRAHAA
jgi:hypothetical protein